MIKINLKYFLFSLFFVLVGSFFLYLSLPQKWKSYKLGVSLKGGLHLEYEANLSSFSQKEKKEISEGLRDILERRLNLFGLKEPEIRTQLKKDKVKIFIDLPGVKTPEEAKKIVGETPFLEFKLEKDGKYVKTGLTGRYLKKAYLRFDQQTGKPVVALEFDKKGAEIFEKITEKNVGKRLAIFIDGKLISSPQIKEKISGGKAVIEGDFSLEYAKKLAQNLAAGALPVPIKLVSEKSISPSFGEKTKKHLKKAIIFSFILIGIFLFAVYQLRGVLSFLSLVFWFSCLMFFLKLINATLSLASIAGIVLSLGMAVDANILIFERLREELKESKPISLAKEIAFERAWSAIRDGNVTTLLVCGVLFLFSYGFLQGFALSLSLGIILSVFSSMVVLKIFMKAFYENV